MTHRGRVTVVEAKLYTRPAEPPKVIGGALTPETARFLGGWADGLITVSQSPEALRRIVEAFHAGGGAGKPLFLQVKFCYAASDDEALRMAHEQWCTNTLPSAVAADLRLPGQFEAAARSVRPEDVAEAVRVSSDPGGTATLSCWRRPTSRWT